MIVDLTDSFFEYAATSRKSYTQANWHASSFIKSSTSHLLDLNLLDSKLFDLQKIMRAGARFERQSLSNKIVNVKEHLKLCEQNIKRVKIQQVDIKSRKQMAQKLKESVLIAMELRLLNATFRFKEIHLSFAKQGGRQSSSNIEPGGINLSKSHFLQSSQSQVLEQVASQQFKQIQTSIHELSQMYRQTMHVVRMHELLIDSIEGHIDDTDENVQGGRRNLSELNSKEQKNRQFIYKVFGVLYLVVFVYLVGLS